MTFGATENKPWVEALPTEQGQFSGRTFSRFHVMGDSDSIPTVCEIWATSDHAVEAHAHNADELLYVVMRYGFNKQPDGEIKWGGVYPSRRIIQRARLE